MNDSVVVTAISLHAPFGRTKEDLWTLLSGEVRVPGPVDRFPVAGCRARKAYLHWPTQDIEVLLRGACETAREALAAAGLPAGAAEGRRIGLAVGSISGMDLDRAAGVDQLPDQTDEAAGPVNAVAQYCFDRIGLTGPLVHVMSACTSSAAALFWAKAALDNDDAEVMLVGGADRIRAVDFAGFNVLRAMDPDRTRPFHDQRRGITMGEGACFLVLEKRSHALARNAEILAVFSGAGLSCDAHHATAPRFEGLVAAGRQALRSAGLNPADISYVNCHGTGTSANDSEELRGLQAIFGAHLADVHTGSTKGFTGHWLGSAGALEAAITVLVLRKQRAPAMPWLGEGENILAPFTRAATDRCRGFTHLMSNSLGFGGSNASLVFSKHDA